MLGLTSKPPSLVQSLAQTVGGPGGDYQVMFCEMGLQTRVEGWLGPGGGIKGSHGLTPRPTKGKVSHLRRLLAPECVKASSHF